MSFRQPIWKSWTFRAVLFITLIIELILGLAYVKAYADEPLIWAMGATVEYNDGDAPIETEDLLEYAIWSWSERSGMDIRYAGDTQDRGDPRSGVITVRWADQQEINQAGGNERTVATTQYYHAAGSRLMTGAIILLNRARTDLSETCWQTGAIHELGHALGVNTHHPDTDALMHATQYHCRYALTHRDSDMVLASRQSCHVELTREGDLYIPSIAGQSAYLSRVGTQYRWELTDLRPATETCESGTVDGSLNLDLPDVRGVDAQYRVRLQWAGDDQWTLYYAE